MSRPLYVLCASAALCALLSLSVRSSEHAAAEVWRRHLRRATDVHVPTPTATHLIVPPVSLLQVSQVVQKRAHFDEI